MGKETGNLSMPEMLVLTSAYVRPYRVWGRGMGGESQGNLTGDENAIFSWWEITRCFWATSVFLGGKSHDHCSYWKRISINGKKKLKRILSCLFGGRQKVQVTKFAFKGLHLCFLHGGELVLFWVSEVFQGFKVHDFEHYGQRNYALKWEFNLCH